MVKAFEGSHDGTGLRVAVVAARFNAVVCDQLVEGAVTTLAARGVADDAIDVIRVPGAFEIPTAAMQLARANKHDAIIGLGAVVRGETPHFDYVCQAVTHGLIQVTQETGIPALFGVLTTETMEQALARSGGAAGNKGADSAIAAIEMARLQRLLSNRNE